MAAPKPVKSLKLREVFEQEEAKDAFNRLTNAVVALSKRVELLDVFLGPKREDLMFDKPFQVTTVQPGQTLEGFREVIDPGYVGVITHVGNDWFSNTVLNRYIDSRALETGIRRQIAPVNQPLAVKIFVRREVVWTITNNDAVAHTFGILTNGYVIPADLYDRAVGVEG